MAPKEPLVVRNKDEMRKWSRAMRSQGKIIGFVPTMGFLHEGHLSLVKEAHKHSDVIAVSIYVNPGQFSPNEDLSTYPSDFNGDIQKLMSVPGGVDAVFHPYNLYDYGNEMENGESGVEGKNGAVVSCVEKTRVGHETWVRVEKLEKGLCGKSRPIFFRGVATIVTKLFNIVEPDVAVFGKKDYQQWRIIQRMVGILTNPVRILKRVMKIGKVDGRRGEKMLGLLLLCLMFVLLCLMFMFIALQPQFMSSSCLILKSGFQKWLTLCSGKNCAHSCFL